jgi:hypothetical protein
MCRNHYKQFQKYTDPDMWDVVGERTQFLTAEAKMALLDKIRKECKQGKNCT